MPLNPGTSKQAFSGNVSEMMHKYAATGSIGNTKPVDKKKAQKIALAAAYSEMRRGK